VIDKRQATKRAQAFGLAAARNVVDPAPAKPVQFELAILAILFRRLERDRQGFQIGQPQRGIDLALLWTASDGQHPSTRADRRHRVRWPKLLNQSLTDTSHGHRCGSTDTDNQSRIEGGLAAREIEWWQNDNAGRQMRKL
jgi:hypothetical protein